MSNPFWKTRSHHRRAAAAAMGVVGSAGSATSCAETCRMPQLILYPAAITDRSTNTQSVCRACGPVPEQLAKGKLDRLGRKEANDHECRP